MDQQTAQIIALIIIGIAIFFIIKIIKMIKRGFYKIASIYIALTAGSGGGLTLLINQITNNPQ